MLWTVLPLVAERRARFPGHLVQQSSTFDTTRIRSSSCCRKFPPLDRTKPLTFVALRNRACMLNFVVKRPSKLFHFLSLIAYQLQLTKFSCFMFRYCLFDFSYQSTDKGFFCFAAGFFTIVLGSFDTKTSGKSPGSYIFSRQNKDYEGARRKF